MFSPLTATTSAVGLRRRLQRRVESRGVRIDLQCTLRQLHAERRQFGDPGRDLDRTRCETVGLDELADEPPPVGFVCRDGATGQHPIGGDAGSDDPGEVIAHAHLRSGQAEQDGGIAECRCRGADPDVGRQAQREPCADAWAVDGGDDGLRQIPDRLRQCRHRLLEPQPIDGRISRVGYPRPEISHVDAGAETACCAGQDDGIHRCVVGHRCERLGEFAPHDVVDRVELLRPVQRQHNDAGVRPFDDQRLGHRTQRRGKPSTCWAMMLRWISDVPPAMVPPKLRA